MKEFEILPFRVEECLNKCFEQKIEENDFSVLFQKGNIREQIFDILECFCTIVYFPLKSEADNNGFKLTDVPSTNGKKESFVFINTSQTIEKQVFTAAHELGHIWDVDEYVLNELGEELNLESTTDVREEIVNRFAALLLMPKDEFLKTYDYVYKKFADKEGNISIINMIRVIVELMNQFLTPYKSIVYRLVELGKIYKETGELLLGQREIREDTIFKARDEIISQSGFTHLLIANERKWIYGLTDLISRAEKSGLAHPEKIRKLQEAFDLTPATGSNEISLPIKTQEEE